MSKLQQQARAAGVQYADDQIQSDYFDNWVFEQLHEGARPGSQAAPGLETENLVKVEPSMELAGRMLQQLVWDTQRDLEASTIEEYLRAQGVLDPLKHKTVVGPAFWEGLREHLRTRNVRSWVAEKIRGFAKHLTRTRGSRHGDAMKTIGYQVLVFNEGSSTPETVSRVNTEAEAERLKVHFQRQARQHGWRKNIEIRPVRRGK